MVELDKLLEEARKDWEAGSWEGTFADYLRMAVAAPDLARHTHARIYDMIQWAGNVPGPEGVPRYRLFEDEVFGMDPAIDRVVEFFHAATTSLEVRKRILLLMGPPAGGKSTIVNLIKSGLERYSRSDEGAVYSIKGCPMQEQPLHLIPEERREQLKREHGVEIEGDLCPRCRYNLRHQYDGDIARVLVRRVHISQPEGVGMGSFVATSAHSQDIARLVGSVDTSSFTEDRIEGAGKGLRLDGELEAANRGVMDFIEIFKSDERFLAILLGVTQEQTIKLGSFGAVYADEAIIGHSNEEEYDAFISAPETAALKDRLILVKIPYNLRVSDEVKTYGKMFSGTGTHGPDRTDSLGGLSPLTLRVAATLAVLSRLEAPGRSNSPSSVPPLDRLRLYDGLFLPPHTPESVEDLREELPREGMFGLSPRYVINRLAHAQTREKGCLTPLRALSGLVEGLTERAGLSKEERQVLLGQAMDAVSEYRVLAMREAQKAATPDFSQKAASLFRSYVEQVEAYCEGDASEPPDERVLRSVEGALGLRDGDRPRFRRGVCQSLGYLRQRPEASDLTCDSIPTLKRAIENSLFASRDEVKLTLDPGRKDVERQQERQMIQQRLFLEHGYCLECAEDLMHFAWRTFQGKEVVSVRNGKLSVV